LMTYFAFPSTVYDQPKNLLAVLGSWWAEGYAGSDQVESIVRGKSQVEQQTMLDVMELLASISRFTVPIYHTDNWYPLYLRESQRNDSTTSYLKYDSGATYGSGYHYDDPRIGPYHSFPKPADLVEAPLILNRFVDPTFSQSPNIDFILEPDVITFRDNPFNNPKVATRLLYEKGKVVDREAILWVHRGQFDWDTVYQQFAYVFGMRLKSSPGYRDLMNAIYDSAVGGMGRLDVASAISAMTGIPLVKEATEVVEDIVTDRENLLIITDLSTYKFARTAVPTVQISETVHRGQTLTDSLRIDELNLGKVPSGLHALALGKGFLSTCFYGDLIFEDREVPLYVDENDPSGYTRVSWDLGGFPLDVAHFFDELHSRGVAEANRPLTDCKDHEQIEYPANDCDEPTVIGRRGTMAHLLDRRARRVGETKREHLPTTINPLRFLTQNILRNNAFVVRVKAREATNGVGLQNVRILRKVLPPHTAMILVVDLTVIKNSVLSQSINEQVSTFTGMTPVKDQVSGSVSARRLTVRVVTGTCQ
jgi:hypothetical protein